MPEKSIEKNVESDFKILSKRRLELIFLVITIFCVAAIIWGQVNFFGTDSWVFFILININAILMLVVLFLVTRNVIKLIFERKRKIFGSRLRSRLLVAFFSVSFVPILIMFLASNKLMTTNVNYWFNSKVGNSMQAALEVGQSFYTAAVDRLKDNGIGLIEELENSEQNFWYSKLQDNFYKGNLDALAVIKFDGTDQDGHYKVEDIQQHLWLSRNSFQQDWKEVQSSINFNNIKNNGFESILLPKEHDDYVICVLPFPENKSFYLVIVESIGQGLLKKLDNISTGLNEYAHLKSLKQPLKFSFSLILITLSLLVLFASVWVAFRIANELLKPISALSAGTEQLAKGIWDVQVDDAGQDELKQLVNSFNSMTAEIRENQARLAKMNILIEERNEILVERNQYIETLLENITTGIATLDEKGTLVSINQAMCDMFQVRAEKLENIPLKLILSPNYTAMIDDMYLFLQQYPHKAWSKELEFLRNKHYLKVFIQAVALPTFIKQNQDEEKSPSNTKQSLIEKRGSILLVIDDITEISQDQRLAAWQEVAKRIAHEIKNPLTPIRLSSERLQRKYTKIVSDPVFTQCTDLIIKEVERMEKMVGEFSSFAALPSINLELNPLAPILHDLVELFKVSHSNIVWTYEFEKDLPLLFLDKSSLHRAIYNIFSNATDAIYSAKELAKSQDIDFTGHVYVKIYSKRSEPLKSQDQGLTFEHNPKEKEQHNVIIEIFDNGKGIDEEEAARLFEPYFSRKPKGTGLGLAIVRSIINDHKGQIMAFTKDAHTCIRISLPIPTQSYQNIG